MLIDVSDQSVNFDLEVFINVNTSSDNSGENNTSSAFSTDVSLLESRFGFINNPSADNYVALQACADYCIANNKRMVVPYLGYTIYISKPIAPDRKKGINIFLDNPVININPAIGMSTVFGCVFWAGHITHPMQSQIEGLNNGQYLHRIASGITIGDKEVVVDATLYNAVEAGEIVLVRSDLLCVDRTGEAIPTAGDRRYGVYDYSVLNKIVEKKLSRTDEYILVFEHPFEETVYEPRIVRFPVGDDTIYIDSNLDDPRLYVGPCENFILKMSDRGSVGTSGNQGFIQATCLYNFEFENITVSNAVGAFICNSLCYGTINTLKGNIKGPVLAIAFNSTNVECKNIQPTVNGPADSANQLVKLTIVDNTNIIPTTTALSLFNQLQGAIDNFGQLDYDYDAVWYATNNRKNAILYNKNTNSWIFYQSISEMWSVNTKPVFLNNVNIVTSGWGNSYYIPQGSITVGDFDYNIEQISKENRSTINIHEGARNIYIDGVNISTAKSYDYGDTDVNLVGKGLTITNVNIYSNRFVDLNNGESIDSDSLVIGNSMNEGDIPFNVKNINVTNINTTGKPVNSVVEVTECPLYPSKDTISIRLEGSFAGNFDRDYILNINSVSAGTTTILNFGSINLDLRDFIFKDQYIVISQINSSNEWVVLNTHLKVVNVTINTITVNYDSTGLNAANYVANSGIIYKNYFNYLLQGNNPQDGNIIRSLNSTENFEDRYYLYYSSFRNAVFVFSINGYAGKGKGWYMLPTNQTPVEPLLVNNNLIGVDFSNITTVYDENDSFSFSTFSSGTYGVYLGHDVERVIFGPCKKFTNVSGETLTFIPEKPYSTFTGISFDNIKSYRASLRGVYTKGGVRNSFRNINFERFVPINIFSENIPSSRFLVDVETVNVEYVKNNIFDNIITDDTTYAIIEPIRNQGVFNSFTNIFDQRTLDWKKLNRRYFRQSSSADTSLLRSAFDFSPPSGVLINPKTGRIKENTTFTFDSLLFDGSSFRTGYELYIRFSGKTQSTPIIDTKAITAFSGTSLVSILESTLPQDNDFELNIHIQVLDTLSEPDGTPAVGRWFSISNTIKSANLPAVYYENTKIIQLNTTGGVKRFQFDVICGNGEQVDLFAYIVEAKSNIH